MADAMWVDPVELRGACPGVATVADAVRAALLRLAGALEAEGACWGADEMGQRFGSTYQPAESTVRDAFAGLGQGIAQLHERLGAVADQADEVDARAQARLG